MTECRVWYIISAAVHESMEMLSLRNTGLRTQVDWGTWIVYMDTGILRYCDTAILRYCDTGILQYCDTAILQYCNTAILQYCDTVILGN